MRHRALDGSTSSDAFTDLLFNALLGFAMMFIIAFMLINDPDDAGKIDSKAEMLITVRWADGHPDDVDALVEGPHGEVVWYHNRDGELMHLDRDDRGLVADRVTLDGKEVLNPINQETVTVRARRPNRQICFVERSHPVVYVTWIFILFLSLLNRHTQ